MQKMYAMTRPWTKPTCRMFWHALPDASFLSFGSVLASLRFRRHGLSLDVDIHWLTLPSTKDDDTLFPVILVSDLVEALGRSGNMQRLWGDVPEDEVQATLLEFWRRYAQDSPDHEVYRASREGSVSLARSIPYLIHGDEGRGLKKKGVMLLSIQGILGRGTRTFMERFKDARSEGQKRMGLNIGGHSFGSRLLFAAMMKKHYENPEPWLFVQSACDGNHLLKTDAVT